MFLEKPLRVLLVTETYPPEINGVAMTTQRLVQGLRDRGHWVGLVRPRQAQDRNAPCPADTWTLPSLPIPQYPGLRLGLPVWRRLGRLLEERRPDLVHVVTEGPLGWAAVHAARSRGLPVTSGYHTHFDQYSGHYGPAWLTPWVTRWLDGLHRRCQATFVPTPELAAQLCARGIPNVGVMGRGVDNRLFHPDRRDQSLRVQWGLGADDLACLYVGRLAPEKNLAVVEQAFAAIARKHARAHGLGGRWSLPVEPARETPRPYFSRAACGRGPGIPLCQRGSVPVRQPLGNLGQRHHRSPGQRTAGAGLSARGGGAIDPGRENGLTAAVGDASDFIGLALASAADPELRLRLGRQATLSMRDWGWEAIIERFEALLRACAATRA